MTIWISSSLNCFFSYLFIICFNSSSSAIKSPQTSLDCQVWKNIERSYSFIRFFLMFTSSHSNAVLTKYEMYVTGLIGFHSISFYSLAKLPHDNRTGRDRLLYLYSMDSSTASKDDEEEEEDDEDHGEVKSIGSLFNDTSTKVILAYIRTHHYHYSPTALSLFLPCTAIPIIAAIASFQLALPLLPSSRHDPCLSNRTAAMMIAAATTCPLLSLLLPCPANTIPATLSSTRLHNPLPALLLQPCNCSHYLPFQPTAQVNIHTYIHTYMLTYIHTYIHTCLHTYIHA